MGQSRAAALIFLGLALSNTKIHAQTARTENSTCALENDGSVSCARTDSTFVLEQVPPSLRVLNGSTFGYALTAGGDVWGWSLRTLVPVKFEHLAHIVQIAGTRESGVCARGATGFVWCWRDHQVNEGIRAFDPPKISWIRGALSIWVTAEISCADLPDGRVSCWNKQPHAATGSSYLSGPTSARDERGFSRYRHELYVPPDRRKSGMPLWRTLE